MSYLKPKCTKCVKIVFFLFVFIVVNSSIVIAEEIEAHTRSIAELIKESNQLKRSDPAKSRMYAESALQRSKKVKDTKNTILALHMLGFLDLMEGKHETALSSFQESLRLSQTINDSTRIASSFNNIGNFYNYRGFKDKALEYYLKSLHIKESLGLESSVSVALTNIGIIYDDQGEFEKALEHYIRSLKIKTKLGDSLGMALVSSNIGALYLDYGKLDLADQYLSESLRMSRSNDDLRMVKSCLLTLSRLAYQRNNFEKALSLANEGLDLEVQLDDFVGMSETYTVLANLYWTQEQLVKALGFAQEAVEYAKYSNSITAEIETNKILSKLLAENGYHEKALEIFQYHSTLRDSVQNEQSRNHIQELEVRYETELKEKKIALKEKSILLLEKESIIQKNYIIGLVIFLIVISLLFYARYSRQKLLIKKKETDQKLQEVIVELLNQEMEIKNKELLSFTIQTAQKNESIEQLRKDINLALKSMDSDENGYRSKIQGVFNSMNYAEKDWDVFKIRFEQVESGFLKRLEHYFPNLSSTDIKVCAMLRLKLSSKEVASILNIEPESVNKSRYRIRKKMSLLKEQDLVGFLGTF
ncbi:MAG: tetratricopeptide (TPR) repeat protein [Salibacteraceae bacterium]|jgi:tetratricopeptide (TPR) repeat protein